MYIVLKEVQNKKYALNTKSYYIKKSHGAL